MRTRANSVETNMLRGRHDHEILGSIVEFVTVNMVNMLIRTKRSTQMLLHDKAMLSDMFTVDRVYPVAGCFVKKPNTGLMRNRGIAMSFDPTYVHNAIAASAAFMCVAKFLASFGFTWFRRLKLYATLHVTEKLLPLIGMDWSSALFAGFRDNGLVQKYIHASMSMLTRIVFGAEMKGNRDNGCTSLDFAGFRFHRLDNIRFVNSTIN